MTAKEYLRSMQHLDRRIDAKLELAMRLRSQAERITSTMNPNRGSGRTVRDASASIDRLIDLEREVNEMVDELVDHKRGIEDALRNMCDPTQALVLELRYLNGKSWDIIADELHYDRVSVWRIHGQALANFHAHERCNTMQHSNVL